MEADISSDMEEESRKESEPPKRKRSRQQYKPETAFDLYRPVTHSESAEELFGRSVGLTLITLSPRTRALTKLNIQQILVNAELGHLKQQQRKNPDKDPSTFGLPDDDYSQPYVLTQQPLE